MAKASAERFVPESTSLRSLRAAAASCKGCDLYRDATQTVFGAGPAHARVMMLGEQPGDQEDRQGKPFVGPAGRILDRAFEDVGIDRSAVYLTNVVKHFKFTGLPLPDAESICGVGTVHPSAVLRAPDRESAYAGFRDDLAVVAGELK